MSIILVDDDTDITRIIEKYLGWVDQRVDAVAHDMGTAMKLDEWETAKLAIIDFHLPDGDGKQLCEWVRAHYPDVVRVLLTGRPELLRGVEFAHYVFSKLDLRGKAFADVVKRYA